MNGFVEEETRRRIYDLISKNPGLYLSKIAEMLNVRISLAEHILSSMEEKREIIAALEEGYIRYYIKKNRIEPHDIRTRETRRKIYVLISKNPGLHLSKIAEILDMRPSLAEYHLTQMQKNNLIVGVKEEGGYYKRFYLKDSDVGISDKNFLKLLRQELLLKVVLLLLKNSVLKHKELSERLNVVPSTLSYHLKKLIENGIIGLSSYGKEKGYTLKNRKEIIKILKKYEFNIELHLAIEDFKDIWGDLDYWVE